MKKNIPPYQCTFCNKRFVREVNFLAHHCRQMVRDDEFRTPLGQAAWSFYQRWMKEHRRIVPRPESFLQSKFYGSFMRFAKFAQKVQLPDPESFIWLMKDKDMPPSIWVNDQVYTAYLEFLDRKATPLARAKTTIDTLFKIADSHDVAVENVFDVLEPTEVIDLLRERRVSPWILLNSTKFTQFFLNVCSPEQRIIVESIIRPVYWGKQFKSYPDDLTVMRKMVEELSL